MHHHLRFLQCALPLLVLLTACGGGGSGSSTPAPTATPAPTPTPTPTPIPVISNLAVGDIAGQRVTLSWTTDRACKAEVSYLKTGGTAMVRKLTDLATTRTLTLDLLEPATSYTATVKVTDANSLSASQDQAFTTGTGYSSAGLTVTVDPGTTRSISPYIYGVNVNGLSNAPSMLTVNRLGGNRWTAYNWENNASNAGSDWHYSNDNNLSASSVPGEAVRSRIEVNRAANQASVMTVQMQGYVSADENGNVDISAANPLATRLASRFRKVIEKKGAAFEASPNVGDSNVYMDEFVWAMERKFPGMFNAGASLPTFVDLDNEPELWNTTHEEVQGTSRILPADYVTKTVTLAKALKDQFPSIQIMGPVHYGIMGIYAWQDQYTATPNGSWFTDYYLAAMKTASDAYGSRLLDHYDFHWYPEVYVKVNPNDTSDTRITAMTGSSLTDAEVQAIVQSPRDLWDASFTNANSWVSGMLGGPVKILSRLQAKVDANYPGTGLAITEYYNGGDTHVAGALAEADNLGVFGLKGVQVACMWPNDTTVYPFTGFKSFRGFDGASACFGDTSIAASSSDVAKVSAYVSKDSSGGSRVVIVAINRSNTAQDVAFSGLPSTGTAKVYRVDASNTTAPYLAGSQSVDLSNWVITLPPLTISTIEIK